MQPGGALITEGSTTTLMAEFNLAGGVTVEHPANLFARGSILRGVFSDLKSPIAYGYDGKDMPVYFNQDPVLNAAAGGLGGFGGGGGRGAGASDGQNVTPNAQMLSIQSARSGGCGAAGGGSRRPEADVAVAVDGAPQQPAAEPVARSLRAGGGRTPAARRNAVPLGDRRHAALRNAERAAKRSPIARWRWTCRWARATS